METTLKAIESTSSGSVLEMQKRAVSTPDGLRQYWHLNKALRVLNNIIKIQTSARIPLATENSLHAG